MAFKVGDKIVYPAQGAGKIDEVTTREILGETKEYLKLSFLRGEMDVLVPLDKSEEVGLRHTFGDDEVDKLYATLRAGDFELPSQWPPRHRIEQEVLARGEAFEMASLIGTLSARDVERGLADTEREIMERAKDMLASELAVVTGIKTLPEAKARINEEIKSATEA